MVENTISRQSKRVPDAEMGAIGYAIGAGLLVVSLPLLPFVALYWLLDQFLTSND